jgi:hypothetical protein
VENKDVIAKDLSQPFSTFQPFLSSFSLIYFEVVGLNYSPSNPQH